MVVNKYYVLTSEIALIISDDFRIMQDNRRGNTEAWHLLPETEIDSTYVEYVADFCGLTQRDL